MNEPPRRRERTATNSRVVVAVLVVSFFAMLGAIYLVVRGGRL